MFWIFFAVTVFFILALLRPHAALGVLVSVLPLYLVRFHFIIPTTFLELLVGAFLLATALTSFNRESLKKIKNLGQINWVVFLFVLAGIIAVLVSPEQTRALGQFKAFIIEPVLLFYASILTIKSTAQLKTALRLLLLSSALIAAFGLIQYATNLFLPLRFWGGGLEPKRIVSVFEYPNALALYLSPLFVFFLILRLNKYDLLKSGWLEWLVLLIMGVALVLTFSRGAWLGVIVSVIVFLLSKISFKTALAVILGLIIVAVSVPAIKTRIGQIFDDSNRARLELVEAATDKIISSPILGNGLFGFRATLNQAGYSGEILNYPHNVILNFWLELGLLGLISFFLILFGLFWRHKKTPTLAGTAVMFFLLTMLVHGLVDVPYFKNDLAAMFWFIASLSFLEP